MTDAPPPPNCRLSSFMLSPLDWSKNISGGRIVSKSERFPTPKTNSPHHSIGPLDSPSSARGPNPAGYSFRSKSPRLPVNKPVSQDIFVGPVQSPVRGRAASMKTTSPRFESPKPVQSAHTVLGPTDWTAKAGAPSPTYRSHSPRIGFHKAYEGPQSVIELPSTMLSPSRGHTPTVAVFRSKSPRLPVTKAPAGDVYVPEPSTTRDGRSALVAKCDARASTMKNGGHAFGDGSRSR